jgi:hypothetical protein
MSHTFNASRMPQVRLASLLTKSEGAILPLDASASISPTTDQRLNVSVCRGATATALYGSVASVFVRPI